MGPSLTRPTPSCGTRRTVLRITLRWLGVGKEDRVFALAGRIPTLYTAALGTLKNTSVFLSIVLSVRSGAGPPAVAARQGKVLVTTERLYRKTIAELR